jgi:hypothetical protein
MGENQISSPEGKGYGRERSKRLKRAERRKRVKQ